MKNIKKRESCLCQIVNDTSHLVGLAQAAGPHGAQARQPIWLSQLTVRLKQERYLHVVKRQCNADVSRARRVCCLHLM